MTEINSPDYTAIVDSRSDRIRFLKAESGARLTFSPEIEPEFAHYRSSNFLPREKKLLTIGIILYLFFIWSDLVPLPPEYCIWIASARAALAAIMGIGLYIALSSKHALIDKYAMHITSIMMFIGSLHVCVAAIFLPHPDDYIYILGIIPLFLAIIAILRYHFILCAITMLSVLSVCAMVLFVIPEDRELMTQITSLDTFIRNFPVLFFLFLFSIVITGLYLSYAFEKMLRENWIEQNISLLEADNMQDMTTRLRELTRQDELTQIANRRHFHEKLTDEISRAHRDELALSLLMLDIDYFKSYNDKYGHQAGDLCLQKVANCLEYQSHRTGDLVARYGGEEFIVLLPHTDAEGAAFMADSIRLAIELLKVPHDQSPFGYVTVSIGVTTVMPNEKTSMKDIIRQADDALYHAKRSGRNRYEVYSHDTATIQGIPN